MKRKLAGLLACMTVYLCTGCSNPADSPADTAAGSTESTSAPASAQSTEPTETEETDSTDTTAPDESTEDVWEGETTANLIPPSPGYTVRNAAWTDVQWTQYQCAYFTLKVPEGWNVQWKGNSEALVWQAQAGDGTVLGLSNTDHLTAAKSKQVSELLQQSFYLEKGTVEELFGKMFANTTDYFTVQNSCVPANKDMLQSLRRDKAIWDYRSLYAIFSENGVEGEGIYSAVIMEAPDLILTGGYNYAMWEINGIFTEYAPRGELVNWQPVLREIAQSFTYTDYYWQEMMQRIGSRQEPVSNTNDTDPVMEAFEERMTEDTILQEKRSDMIGEYERVYDNDTGNIYRAYDGFLDDLGSDQTRWSPITDSQYAEGYVGWIDK